MPSLSLSNQETKEAFALLAGVSRDDADWDADTLSDFNRMLRAGRRKFFAAHQWMFLEQDVTITTTAPYTTGTIVVVDGVVTLSGGTLPGTTTTLPQQYVLSVSNGLYEIDSRDSDTQCTLKDTSLDVASGTSYSIYRVKYPLASNFAGFIQPVALENENRCLPNNGVFPNFTVERLLRRSTITAGKPQAYAVAQEVTETSGETSYFLVLAPMPDAAYVIWSRIRISPEDTVDFDDATSTFDAVFAECLLEAVLAATELYYHSAPGAHTAEFEKLLQRSIIKDRQMRGTKNLMSRRRVGYDPLREVINGRGTYEGPDF